MTDTPDLPTRSIARFGWKRSLPDARDILADASGIKVLAEVDPRGVSMTEVYDQGQLGSCTANALAAAIDAHRIVEGLDPFRPSRLALYALERLIEGSPLTADTGAFGRDGLKAARRYGLLPETGEWAYSDRAPAWQQDPRPALKARTDDWRLDHTYKVVPQQLAAIKAVLSNGQTIAFGFSVAESFESAKVASTGVYDPQPGESVVGGHEVLLVGYLKDEPNYGLVRNSWGSGWGIGGYFLMPWHVLLDRSVCDDLRTIYRPA